MTASPLAWGRFYSGGCSPPGPHCRRRWLSNEPKMNIVRSPKSPMTYALYSASRSRKLMTQVSQVSLVTD